MIRILIGLLFTAMLGAAFAAPPIDFEVVCGEAEEAPLVGVLSLTEGGAHLALLPDVVCEDDLVVVAVGDTELDVALAWDGDTQTWSIIVDEVSYGDGSVKVVVVPPEAVDGMLAAHRQRTAAFERAAANRERAQERAREEAGELDRDRDRDCEPDCGDGNPDAPGPPDGLPPAENPDPPVAVPGPAPQGPGHGRP